MLTLVHADPRERIPLAEQHPVAPVPLVSTTSKPASPENWPATGRTKIAAASAPYLTRGHAVREQHGRQRGQGRRGQHHAGRADPVEQRDEHEAAGRSADEVGRVDGVDARASRDMASVMTSPPVKNGSAASP